MVRTALLAGMIFAGASWATVIVDKTPNVTTLNDVCCLSSDVGGDNVFADSFVFTGGAADVATTIGAWMTNWDNSTIGGTTPGTDMRFELWTDNAGKPGIALGVTPYFQDASAVATLETQDLITPVPLVANTRYWLVESVVGQTPQGDYAFEFHQVNSDGIDDNGSFDTGSCSAGVCNWFAYSGSGGRFNLPETTVYVADNAVAVLPTVPEPGAASLIGLGLVAVGLWRSRALRRHR